MSSPSKNPAVSAVPHIAGSDALPYSASGSSDISPIHGAPEVLDSNGAAVGSTSDMGARPWQARFGYLTTKDFWMVLLLGQFLALCLTGTNALTTLLVIEGTSIPAFQTLFNYILLNVIYTSYTVYKYGPKGWVKLIWKDGWKCKLPLFPFSRA